MHSNFKIDFLKKELAKESDLMVVVGSKKSANTSHLAEILKASFPETYSSVQ